MEADSLSTMQQDPFGPTSSEDTLVSPVAEKISKDDVSPTGLNSPRIIFGGGSDDIKAEQSVADSKEKFIAKRQASFRKIRQNRRSSLMAVSDRFNETVNNFQDKMRSTGSLIKRCVSVHSSMKPVDADPKHRLDNLLGKLYFEFNTEEVDALKRAYHCEVCNDTNAPCHQIRAVYDAFNLAWSEEGASKEGLLGLADLEVFVSKCELGKEFLERIRNAMADNLALGPDGKIGAREFLVVFAYALRSLSPEERLLYNRAFGRMLGVEMTKQRFRWNKFFVAALAYNAAPVTDLFCFMERRSPPLDSSAQHRHWILAKFVALTPHSSCTARIKGHRFPPGARAPCFAAQPRDRTVAARPPSFPPDASAQNARFAVRAGGAAAARLEALPRHPAPPPSIPQRARDHTRTDRTTHRFENARAHARGKGDGARHMRRLTRLLIT